MNSPLNLMVLLGKYLNEHLSGSAAALDLLEALGKEDQSADAAYTQLEADILANRQALEAVMAQAGFKRSRGMQIAARVASHLALVRFRYHGLEPGSLGLVEALESLELGVHGQTLLWRSLMEQGTSIRGWQRSDFAGLLAKADIQKAAVEALRIAAVKAAFFPQSSPPDNPSHAQRG